MGGSPLHSQKTCNIRNFLQTETTAKKNVDTSIDYLPSGSKIMNSKDDVEPSVEVDAVSKPSTSDEQIPSCTNETTYKTGCESLRTIQDMNKVQATIVYR